MSSALIEVHYLPSLEYFATLLRYDRVILEVNEHFEKQTYRNRCYILGSNGTMVLTVPVLGGNRNIPIAEIEIDYKQKWVNEHWRGICSAYGKAPFFEYFSPYFEQVYASKPVRLLELNQKLLSICLKLMKWTPDLSYTEKYERIASEGINDLRSVIHPKIDWQQRGIYNPMPYQQIFGNNFVSNLSILDLLFCTGPQAKNILTQSVV